MRSRSSALSTASFGTVSTLQKARSRSSAGVPPSGQNVFTLFCGWQDPGVAAATNDRLGSLHAHDVAERLRLLFAGLVVGAADFGSDPVAEIGRLVALHAAVVVHPAVQRARRFSHVVG